MSAEIGFLTEVLVGATVAATEATVLLGGVTNVTPPALMRDEVDGTAMGGADFMRYFFPGLVDPGELPLEINWLPDSPTETVLRTMFAERAGRVITLRFPMVTPVATCTFRAFLKERGPAVPMDDKMTASVLFRVQTAMTWATEA